MSPNRCGTANRRLVGMRAPYTMMNGVLSFWGCLCICPTVGHLCDQSSPWVSKHLVSIRFKTEWVDLVCAFALGGVRLPLSYDKLIDRGVPSSFFLGGICLATKRAMEPSWKLDKARSGVFGHPTTRRKNGAFKTRQGFLLLGLLWLRSPLVLMLAVKKARSGWLRLLKCKQFTFLRLSRILLQIGTIVHIRLGIPNRM